MIYFAVEQLQADSYAFVLSQRLDLVQKADRILDAFFIRDTFALARENNHVGRACRGSLLNRFAMQGLDAGVVLDAIDAVADRGAAGHHRRHQSMLLEYRPIFGTDQVETLDTQASRIAAHLCERHPLSETAPSD